MCLARRKALVERVCVLERLKRKVAKKPKGGLREASGTMKIVHIFRAPVGGLFRHVLDLAQGQIARGHQVGIIADSLTGGARSNELLSTLAPKLALGLTRIPMHRQPSPLDIASLYRIAKRIVRSGADVVHGHGAKGGALARLLPMRNAVVRAYTPHGGSLHDAVGGTLHLFLERMLMRRGNLYLFESAYSHDAYLTKIGRPNAIVQIVHNGVTKAEFEPIHSNSDATDIVFLGELRMLKGVDILIDAISILHGQGRPLTASIVGDGPDALVFRAQSERLGLSNFIRFHKPMPTRLALAFGRVFAAPSRAESLPYVILEAAAAGKPLVTTRVGGIAEIFGPFSDRLVASGDATSLALALARIVDDRATATEFSQSLRNRVASMFSLDLMVEQVLSAYERACTAARAESDQIGAYPEFLK
jgi:glycosyltransferase involved in cell wall biosynthesis